MPGLRHVVQQLRPVIGGEIEVEAAERPEAADRYRDGARHARHDSAVEQDAATQDLTDFEEPIRSIALVARTEPQVTNVTARSTS
jgi:hypothetical protein